MKIGIIPHSRSLYNDKLFSNESLINNDDDKNVWVYLRERCAGMAIEVHTVDCYKNPGEINVCLVFDPDFKTLHRVMKNGMVAKKLYFALEPEVVISQHSNKGLHKLLRIFDGIMTWNEGAVDDKTIFKIYYPQNIITDARDEVRFSEKKLLTNMSGNKSSDNPNELYSERKKVIDYFEKIPGDTFRFYGPGWDKNTYRNYCGEAPNKRAVYKNFKFALCLENMRNTDGYITEKIFDCFNCEIVPVYLGAGNIGDYVPRECFINYGGFANVADLHRYLAGMKEEEYRNYLESIRKFKKSSRIAVFNFDSFVTLILRAIDRIRTRKKRRDFVFFTYRIAKNIDNEIDKLRKRLRREPR
jgi:hypothetical protein